jgi:acetolactate synthase I/II/III large subunit
MSELKPLGNEVASGTTAQLMVDGLVGAGVKDIFALPGIQNDDLFDAFYQNRALRVIHTRHEQGAAYMAAGYGMASGRPGVYAVVPGPGFLNTTAALSTAYGCSAPVIALAGQIPAAMMGRGVGMLHEIPDQMAVMSQFTKWAQRVKGPSQAGPAIHQALREVMSPPYRPVGLECAMDVWGRRGTTVLQYEIKPELPALDDDAILAAAKLLGEAKRPIIVVGAGAQDASQEVTEVAEMLQAPVSAHRMGRGVVSSSNPLCVDPVAGHILWGDADVVLAVGTRLQMQLMQWGTDANLKVVRIDADPEQLDKIRTPEVGIVGDAATVLRAIANVLPRFNTRRERTDEIETAKAQAWKKLSTLEPQLAYLSAIRAELPEDGIFVDELTQLGYASRALFPVYQPRTFLSPGYQGTLGWGMAAALGAQVACPDRKVVSVIGDGGFLFNPQELATAVQHRIPLVTVLANDNAFGNVRRIQDDQYGGRRIASDLTNPDFVKLTESFGAMALRAHSPDELRQALRSAFKENGPVVIEVPVEAMPDPWKMLRYKSSRVKAS